MHSLYETRERNLYFPSRCSQKITAWILVLALVAALMLIHGHYSITRQMAAVPLAVALVSVLLMAVCGILIKKCKMQWLETYAMSISMIAAMVFAVVITPILV